MKQERVDCPVCDNVHYRSVRGVVERGKIFLFTRFAGEPAIDHHRKVRRDMMRCPLCYGKGWVYPELAVAYQLRFGDETKRIEYSDIDFLRYRIMKRERFWDTQSGKGRRDYTPCPRCLLRNGFLQVSCVLCGTYREVPKALATAYLLRFGDSAHTIYHKHVEEFLREYNSVDINGVK